MAVVGAAIGVVSMLTAGAGPARSSEPVGRAAAARATATSAGYWVAAADGGVFGYGGAEFLGSMGGQTLNRPIVGTAATPSGRGYWLLASDGGIFSYGDAAFAGSTGSLVLNRPIVGMAPTPTGQGYWLVASDGGIFAFGDAPFFGSTASRVLNRPIVGMAATPTGWGYWLVASDGGIFAFGDAAFRGSAGAIRLARPIVGMAATPSGLGYWLVASDGGVFSYGDAPFAGSTGALALRQPIVGLTPAPRGSGYWLVAADGGLFSFGDAPFAGSAAGVSRARVIGMAARPVRLAREVAVFYYPWYGTYERDSAWRHWDAGYPGGPPRLPPGDLGSDYYPARGPYSSSDPALAEQHMTELRAAGVDTVVASWWGRGSYEDSVLPVVVAAARNHGLRVAGHLEPYVGRSAATVVDDVAHLHAAGVTDVYVYEAMQISAAAWAGITGRMGARLFAETGNRTAVLNGSFARFAQQAGFDGIYTYDPVRYGRTEFAIACGTARMRALVCGPSVAPGQVAIRTLPSRRVVARDGGLRYDAQWLEAMDSGADIVTITSYNEWHEGTQIEPAVPYCFPDGTGYCSPGYEGAYGRTGPAARGAYIERTAVWSARFHSR